MLFISKEHYNVKYNMVSINIKAHKEALAYTEGLFSKNLPDSIHQIDLLILKNNLKMGLSDKIIQVLKVINSSEANRTDTGLYKHFTMGEIFENLKRQYNIKFEEDDEKVWTNELKREDIVFLVEYSEYLWNKAFPYISREEFEEIRKQEQRDKEMKETMEWEVEQEEAWRNTLSYLANRSYYKCQQLFKETVSFVD